MKAQASRKKKHKTQTQRGLGAEHARQRKYLLSRHRDGNLCWWCGKPMYKDKSLNPDGLPLAADHTHARTHGGTRADRLLHYSCNSKRGDGSKDEFRPAALKKEKQNIHKSDGESTGAFSMSGISITR